ncbi:MAG: cyclic nucleotide-binding domain-containing protein, partial [Anaerolineae bacterium]
MSSSNIVPRLQQFWIFRGLPEVDLAQVQGFFQPHQYGAGEQLWRQGMVPDAFYLVENGTVLQTGKDPAGQQVLHRKVGPGEFLGHRALLANEQHATEATVPRRADVLRVDAEDFHTLLARFPELRRRLEGQHVINRLLAIPLFHVFDEAGLARIADMMRQVEFSKDQTIYRKGDLSDAFYVVDTGQVAQLPQGGVPGGGSWPRYLTAGSFFGGHGLLNNTMRRTSAQAETDVKLFVLDDEAFEWLVDKHPGFRKAVENPPDVLALLQQSHVFAKLTDAELKELAGYVGLARLRPGDVLYRQGEIDPTFYILYRGEAIVRSRDEEGIERPVGYLKAVNVAGEASLFLQEPRDVTVEATTETAWLYLTRQDLDLFLDKHPEAARHVTPKEEVRARRRLPHLAWMEPGEQMVLQHRRHWFVLLYRLIPPVALLAGTVVVDLLFLGGAAGVLGAVGLTGVALAALWTLWRVLDWLNDYYYVTTQRVAHREKVLGLMETRTEAPLDKVQNVSVQQGIIGNTLGFGELVVDTASAARVSRVVFDHVGNPEHVQAVIFEQMRRLGARKLLESRRMIRSRLASHIDVGTIPQIPRPVLPSEAPSGQAPPARPPWWRRLLAATIGQMFWIEKRTDGQVTWRKHWLKLLQVIWLPFVLSAAAIVLFVVGLPLAAGAPVVIVFLLA